MNQTDTSVTVLCMVEEDGAAIDIQLKKPSSRESSAQRAIFSGRKVVPDSGRKASKDSSSPQSVKSHRIGSSSKMNITTHQNTASIRMIAGANATNTAPEPAESLMPVAGPGGAAMFMGANSLRVNTGIIRVTHLSVMMGILQDPIQCGYLLRFCQVIQ
jgi:hypothetical protein